MKEQDGRTADKNGNRQPKQLTPVVDCRQGNAELRQVAEDSPADHTQGEDGSQCNRRRDHQQYRSDEFNDSRSNPPPGLDP